MESKNVEIAFSTLAGLSSVIALVICISLWGPFFQCADTATQTCNSSGDHEFWGLQASVGSVAAMSGALGLCLMALGKVGEAIANNW